MGICVRGKGMHSVVWQAGWKINHGGGLEGINGLWFDRWIVLQ